MIEYLILLASVIVFAGIIIGKVGSRYGIPALLLFLFLRECFSGVMDSGSNLRMHR